MKMSRILRKLTSVGLALLIVFMSVSLDFNVLDLKGTQYKPLFKTEKDVYGASNVNCIYEKYTCKPYYVMSPFSGNTLSSNHYSEGYTSYVFHKNYGQFSAAGTFEATYAYNAGQTLYTFPALNRLTRVYCDGDNKWYSDSFAISAGYEKENYVTTITAPNGTYPDNGKHSDDYWYVKVNTFPILSKITPQQNEAFCETDTGFIPQISVSDADNNTLTCKYYIDSETSARETKSVSNTISTTNISFNALNIGALTEGEHSIRYEVSDERGQDISTVNFKVDKSAPSLGNITAESSSSNITVYGSATDNISGIHSLPYRYTIGQEVSSWLSGTSYVSQSNLIPNTLYPIKFEARDTKGHIVSNAQSVYTKAVVPALSVNNASSYTLDVATSDNNPVSTQYQISVNNIVKYVTQEGTLTAAPVWITLPNKKITVNGLSPSTNYTFQAKTKNTAGAETAWGATASGTTLVAPPGSPANIVAIADSSTITVSWDAMTGVTGYDVEVDGAIINNGAGTRFTRTGFPAGTPHTFRVRAKNAGGPGNWSAPISKSTLPAASDVPTNLNAVPQSTSITVTWSNVPGATGYDIEVDGKLVSNGPNTNYIHNSLTPGTHHTYRVRSVNAGGKSGWSNPINVTTLLDSAPVPTNLHATPSKNEIKLDWNPVNGATGYEISVDGVVIDNNTKTTFTSTGLAPDSQHIYRVRAKKDGTISEWSAAVVATTLNNVFGTPLNFKVNAEDTMVTLSWEQVTDAVGYDVEADGIIIQNDAETSCLHSGLSTGTEHTYRVRARSAAATSEWSAPVTVTTYMLSTPSNLSATSNETSITATWNVINALTLTTSMQALNITESYDLEFDGSIIPNIQDTTYTFTGLTSNTQHVIRVRAVSASGTSAWSAPLTKSTLFSGYNVPSISAMARKSSIAVNWKALNGSTAYDIDIDNTIIENITATSYIHSGLVPGSQHKYRVRAKNNSGTGNWSNYLTVSALEEVPAIPTNIAASAAETSVLVSWDDVLGVTSYEIEVDGVIVSNGVSKSYLQNGLSPETNHTYRVRARNLSGFSNWSEAKTISTLSTIKTYNIECSQNEVFNLILTASNIQDVGAYTFTVRYNTNELEILDLCGITPKIDMTEGDITNTDIRVAQFTPGTIVFTKTGSAQSWQTWSGAVNSIKFISKCDGQATLTYTIQ